jgi:hypothetical protein
MADLQNLPFSPEALIHAAAQQELLMMNEKTGAFGLKLTAEDAAALADARSDALKGLGRVEVGGGILPKLIDRFKDSPYLWQANYAATLLELVETFYYAKNETEDLLSDGEILAWMKEAFDISCGGSVALLQGRALEQLIREIRYGAEEAYEDGEE